MADLARIGFSADTKALKDAKAELQALKPAADQAAAGVNKFNSAAAGITRGTGGASAGIKSFEAAIMGAATGGDRLTKTALASSTALGTVGRAAVGAAAPIGNLVNVVSRVGTTFAAADAHVAAYRAELAKVPAAAAGATSSINRLGAAANDNINAMQATPGNIAAQFQDIGVTAAAGMNPMIIALQQGTQLSAAMGGGIGNLLLAFRQLFSVTAIVTIGLVALVAAAIQMVDWMKVGQSILLFLADAMEKCAVAAAYLGVVLLIAFSPQIIAAAYGLVAAIISGIIPAIISATGAMIAFAIANPFTALVLAIGLAIGAMWALDDAMGGVFSNILGYVKTAANFIITAFLTAYDTVVATWRQLPSVFKDLMNQALTIRNTATGETWTPFSTENNGAAAGVSGVMRDSFARRRQQGHVGNIGGAIQSGARRGANWLRGMAGGMGADGKPNNKGGRTSDAAAGGRTEADKFADLVKQTEASAAALQVESKALDMTANAAALYRNQQDLLAKAKAQDITLTTEQASKLDELARKITQGELSVAFKEQLDDIKNQGRALTNAGDQIGLYGVDLEFAKYYQTELNKAVDAGIIDLNNMTAAMELQIKILKNRAMALAEQSEGNRKDAFMENMRVDIEKQSAALRQQSNEFGLSGVALAAYRREQELLNSAPRDHQTLAPGELEFIRQASIEWAEQADQIERTRERIELIRGTLSDAFGDFLGNLRDGQSLWKAFGNAALDALGSITSKILQMAADKAINSLLGSLFKMGGSLLGGLKPGSLGADANALMDANSSLFAKGGASDGGVQAFAKGGAFTNSTVSSPTLFKFAKGGSMGLMGEAGPEAIMPLKRGSDGSLGVQVQGAAPAVRVMVTTDDDRFNAYVDDRAETRIAANAPALADAGARTASARSQFAQNRSLRSR